MFTKGTLIAQMFGYLSVRCTMISKTNTIAYIPVRETNSTQVNKRPDVEIGAMKKHLANNSMSQFPAPNPYLQLWGPLRLRTALRSHEPNGGGAGQVSTDG